VENIFIYEKNMFKLINFCTCGDAVSKIKVAFPFLGDLPVSLGDLIGTHSRSDHVGGE